METKLSAIDLFSGCGGMTFGLKKAGFKVVAAVELDELAARTYRLNHPDTYMEQEDIRKIDETGLMERIGLSVGELDLLAACPPCQGFSRLRTLNGIKSNRDDRNRLVTEILDFVKAFRPKAVMIENVPGLKDKVIYKRFLKKLGDEGYLTNWAILNASDYGVPQRRKRLVMLAGKGFEISFGEKVKKKKTVRNAISSLKKAGQSGDYLHDFPENRTQKMRDWISAIPKDGGSRKDLPDAMQRPCHIRSDGFKDVYGRMAWDSQAPTITGGCFNPSKGRFLHPEENRNITMREAALLQTFPKKFRVPPGTSKTAIALMIGNALPPEFVNRQAAQIARCIDAYTGSDHGQGRNQKEAS